MVVDDLHVMSVAVSPGEAEAPLGVDANAVLPSTVTAKRLQVISGWDPEFTKFPCGGHNAQLASPAATSRPSVNPCRLV